MSAPTRPLIMPPDENDAMRDVCTDQAHGNDACNDSTEQETTASRLSRFQEVGTGARNNTSESSEDGDTDASLSVGATQRAADSLAAAAVRGASSVGAPLSPSESNNNSTSAGVGAEVEDDEQNQHVVSSGHTAGGANGIAANDKDYDEELYVHTEVSSAAVSAEGQINGDDNASDAAIASTRGDASTVASLSADNAADFHNRTAAAIRRSIHETPGAFSVTPINAPRGEEGTADEEISGPDTNTTDNSGTTGNSCSNSNTSNHVDVETEQEETSGSDTISDPRRGSTATSPDRPTQSHPSIELAEAWVVEEEGGAEDSSAVLPPNTSTHPSGQSDSSSASPDIDASVEPVVVTVTATPLKERSWFKTPTGITLILFLISLLGFIVALAVAFPARKKASTAAAASRPFKIVIPSMPQDVSDVLEFKYNKVIQGQPIPMAFSADLTVHASTRINDYYGELQVLQYNATLSSWEMLAKYDAEEAKKQDAKDGQFGNSAGDFFGAWVDMSYDGRILAVGLPRDDPSNIPDAGSVRVMEIESDGKARWSLKGYGNYITGVDPFGWTGTMFSLTADGSMIAVASPLASKGRGSINVYRFETNKANTDGAAWAQMGQAIIGDTSGSALAFVKLSEDGSMLATGSMLHGEDSGQLRIFLWDNEVNLWVQMGSTFDGTEKARLGVFPHFSRDGRTVAFSQGGDPHKCHVYQWDEIDKDWERIDDDPVFPDTYICTDLSPDGKKVILCSADEQRCTLISFRSGEWHEAQEFLLQHGFLPYFFEREGEGDKIAGIVAPIGNEEGYTIGFYNIN